MFQATRRRNTWSRGIAALSALLVVAIGGSVFAQSFSLDDNPAFPFAGPPGVGFGAENPYGIPVPGFPPGLAPSPSLLVIAPPATDGSILSPSPAPGAVPAALQHPGPDGPYVASLSSNKLFTVPVTYAGIQVMFSVDRTSWGMPGTDVAAQSALLQAPGDIYTSTLSFVHPGTFAGGLAPAGFPLPTFAGFLPAVFSGPGGGNLLTYNQGLPAPGIPGFGLAAGGVLGPGTVIDPFTPAAAIFPGSHDNVDAFDMETFNVGTPPLELACYFSVYPTLLPPGASSASIFMAPVGAVGAPPVAWAPAPALGLDIAGPSTDCVDGLVMWDNGLVGLFEPGIDYALFSLSPASASLGIMPPGVFDDSTVFYTDFTGLFAVYSPTPMLGLFPDLATNGFVPRPVGAPPGAGDGLDALDVSIFADFDDDFDLDSFDIDALCDIIFAGVVDPNDTGDLDGDGVLSGNDMDFMIATIFGTQYGDSDLDGDVDGADFDDWRIRDSLGDPIGWATGDWDCDGDVDGADFDIWRLRPFDYYPGGEVAAVPEPATSLLLALAVPALAAARRKRRT